MENTNDVEWGMRVLPGVDLTLWLRLAAAVLLVLAIGVAAAITL